MGQDRIKPPKGEKKLKSSKQSNGSKGSRQSKQKEQPKPKPGNVKNRPLLMTDEVVEQICKLISLGNYECVVAQAVGISQQVLIEWKKRGKNSTHGVYRDFWLKYRKAKAEFITRATARIQKIAFDADSKSWQALAWMLERRYPKQYGKKELNFDDVGRGGIQVNINPCVMPKLKQSEIDQQMGGNGANLTELLEGEDMEGGGDA
ncbi:MAG: hypothetical protein WC440_02150 [Candidatus Omnitrophota bacterium]|jgi:hypothetical protein